MDSAIKKKKKKKHKHHHKHKKTDSKEKKHKKKKRKLKSDDEASSEDVPSKKKPKLEKEKHIPVKNEIKPEPLQNGSSSRTSSVTSTHVKNGTSAIKAVDQILAAAESSEESETPVKPDEDSDIEVPVIEEDMNLEDLMRQKVSFSIFFILS